MSSEQPPLAARDGGTKWNSRLRLLRTHALETLLLAGATAALVFTMAVTVRVASDAGSQTKDLEFNGTLHELSLVLEASGRDQVARLEHASLSVGRRVVDVDTIALLADPVDEPAVAKGGFIADQATLFNDYMIRRAFIGAASGAAPNAAAADEGPSLLRAVLTDEGERRLSDRPNPYALTVRSPYAERTWRTVRTSDWRRSGGLLGLEGDVALAAQVADGSRARLNGRDCTIGNRSGQLLLYCQSRMGLAVGRFFDVGFAVDSTDAALGLARAFSYRPRDLWRNGAQQRLEQQAVEAGDVFDVPRVGPFLLSVSEHGTLADGQWINGRQTFTNQRFGTMSFFAAAGRSAATESQSAPLVLGLDAALSMDLEAEAHRFVAREGAALRRVSIIILDVRTGELKAIAEPTRRLDREPLLAYEPLLVGSVVKPIVAAAILSRRPELANITLGYAGDTVRSVDRIPLQRAFANAANGCTGPIGFREFIRCSNNQYAAELLVRSLRADGFRPSGRDPLVPRDVLERSAIADGLAEAFDVDAFGRRTAGRDLQGAAATSSRMLQPWESRPWIVFPETNGTRLDLVARYAFGGWENRWTLLGLAEAYARIATGREVHATIYANPAPAAAAAQSNALPPHVAAAFRRVRGAMRHVGTDGTAAGLSADLSRVLPQGVVLLAKTGTLNERTDRFKSLVLTLGVPADAQESAELTCGLVAVAYFEFAPDPRPRQKRNALPPVHLDFARDPFAAVLARHWKRVPGCHQSGRGTR